MPLKVPLSRRSLFQISALVAGGAGVSLFLRGVVPPGDDLSANATAMAVLADPSGPAEGPEQADVTVVVYTDYQCPACRRAAPALRDAVRADGRTRVRYRDFAILGPRSEAAARVALASVRQGRYPELHHALMAERRPLETPVLRNVAETVGCDWAQIEADLATNQAGIDAMLTRIRGEAFSLGIEGTPAHLIGTTRYLGAMTERQFSGAIAAARG